MKKIWLCLCCCLWIFVSWLPAQVPDTLVENGRKYILHEVLKGQTVYGLSRQYGITEEMLKEDNPGTENGLQTGQFLKICVGKAETAAVHEVQKGENLYQISRKYGVSMQDLYDWNPGLTEHLDVGQSIRVSKHAPLPKKTVATASVTAIASTAEKKSEYNVFLLLPLYLQNSEEVLSLNKIDDPNVYNSIKSFDFIQFYEAALLALEDLSVKGVKVNFYVKDVNEQNDAALKQWIASGLFDKADLIIGPFFRSNFHTLLSYIQGRRTVMVNPFTINVEGQGASLFKVTANYANQAVNLAEYIRQRHKKAQVILLNNHGSDEKTVSAFKASLFASLQDYPSVLVKEVNYAQGGASAVAIAVNPTCENYVVGFFDGEISVTNFVQSMAKRKYDNVTLVVPSRWRKYDQIETEYFATLKTHYIDQFFVDYSRPEVIRFIDRFREAYDIEPTVDRFAFQGYDITLFFVQALLTYGSGFGLEVNDLDVKTVSTKFHFVQGNQQTYENGFTHLYRLSDYRYVDARITDEPVTEPESVPVIGGNRKKNR